ncbi:MAG: protein NO VEIN domain-containing protein [Mycobacterium sp.]|uniref:protein NO VEIN domain-containing protein n=1 Tax=Mycobacterium sp. TaxID=1785 RepID=UPI003F962F62
MTAATHHEDASANSGKADGSRALIATWNPDRGQWLKVGYREAIERTARGETVLEDWSTGNTTNGVSSGERVFLLQQGNQGRGIIASGTVLGEIYQIPHWDPEKAIRGELANTVDIEWECVLPVEDILPKEELNRQLPAIYWSTPRSGVSIKGELADQLEEMWSNHLAGIGRNGSPEVRDAIAAVESVSNPRRKFGRRFTAAENAAIAERAVLVTRQHFEDELGYETEDVGAYVSYDVRASKGQELVKVEVKGTTTDGAQVVLTRNEVALHRAEHPNNALAVVRNITLDRSGEQPVASGGELRLVMPWEVNEDGLSPIAYNYCTGI